MGQNPASKYTPEFRREPADEPDPRAPDVELRRPQRRVRKLEQENELLKKAAAFFAGTQG